MSKNITVSEGNTARVFGNTQKLETRLQGEDAGTCFWVPEDDTEAQPLNITENGLYEASEAGVYGFSEAHVNISKNVTDESGTDWNIHIDDDGIPHITVGDPDDPYSGPDISIDDGTGNIDVHIPGNDPDSWPGWDDLDPDVKTDFDDWMDDPKFPGDWPGWDDMAPEIVDEFDDWIDDGKDPDIWPGWDDLDPDAKADFDGWMDDPKDPDDWPGWEDIDPDAKTDFDDWTADTDTEINPDEAGLDPDEDVDTSFDPDEQDVDMVGTDGDGDDAKVDYDPKTGESDNEKLPNRIQVVQPPTKTTYYSGEAIDFSGMVVEVYLKTGGAWTDKNHPYGVIPNSELILPVTVADEKDATGEAASSDLDTGEFGGIIPVSGHVSYSYEPEQKVKNIFEFNFRGIILESTAIRTRILYVSGNAIAGCIETMTIINDKTGEMSTKQYYYTSDNSYTNGGKTVYYNELTVTYSSSSQAKNRKFSPAVESYGDKQHYGEAAWTAMHGEITGGTQNIPVLWQSPTGEMLESSFMITVRARLS